MRRVITIDDNVDGTKTVHLFNMQGRGTELIMNRAEFDFNCSKAGGVSSPSVFTLNVTCLVDDNGARYIAYDATKDVSSLSNQELFDELTRRNCLVKETVYKRQ